MTPSAKHTESQRGWLLPSYQNTEEIFNQWSEPILLQSHFSSRSSVIAFFTTETHQMKFQKRDMKALNAAKWTLIRYNHGDIEYRQRQALHGKFTITEILLGNTDLSHLVAPDTLFHHRMETLPSPIGC